MESLGNNEASTFFLENMEMLLQQASTRRIEEFDYDKERRIITFKTSAEPAIAAMLALAKVFAFDFTLLYDMEDDNWYGEFVHDRSLNSLLHYTLDEYPEGISSDEAFDLLMEKGMETEININLV